MEGKRFLGHYLIWLMLVLGELHGYKSCIQKERKALLELKTYLASQGSEPVSNTFKYILFTWTNDTSSDCCGWEGVNCTNGRVNELAVIDTMYLPERALFNLSLLHPFEKLRSLNLSWGYREFGGLFDDVEGHKSLKRLRNLEILDFSLNAFNNSILPFIKAATSLTKLFLRHNRLNGPFPFKELKDLINLEVLDLSSNSFNGSLPGRELSALRKLKALDLSNNQISGSIELQGICEWKNLQELDLSKNRLVGQFPLCLTTLSGLRVLDLSLNQLTGKLPSALGGLKSFEYISLFGNNFEGFFSLGWLANLSKLKVFKLYSKSNSLQVELETSWKPKFQLHVIVLRSCNLEKVPHFLLHQKDLRQVDLSDNKISGKFPSWLLANNTKLEVLLLQNNSFTSFQLPRSAAQNLLFLDVSVNEFSHPFPESIGWILPNLRYMNLTNNGFQGNLPSSLGNMKKMEVLEISHNSFQGELPRNFLEGCYSLRILKLSHNKLSGEILPKATNFTSIYALSMDNNQFTGKIGQGLRKLKFVGMLDISNNSLTGAIPSWIGELPLYVLQISNNLLEGEIHISLFNISHLRLLDLSANVLSGGMPPRVNSSLQVMLLLQDNKLSGEIPDTLLENVEILDLRHNRLSGNIPEFINTQSINILLLRGNNFTGLVPPRLCALSNTHLLDLGNNKLNGSIPSCINNISFGLGKEDTSGDYYDIKSSYGTSDVFSSSDPEQVRTTTEYIGIYFRSFLVLEPFSIDYLAGAQTKIESATKHRYETYMGGNLFKFSGLDLSENELSGGIPIELGGLVELHALNLSHNYLSGIIPKRFSGMKNVESLDLSFNRLQGRIPQELTELNSLAVFNISYNNLSGVIPQGRQFNTFDTQSYLGNPLLCGRPSNISCNGNNFQEPENDDMEADEPTIDMESFYWCFTVAYVMLLVGILASLSFDSCWSRAWFHIVDALIHKVKNLLW